jgi:predicted small secreted protein
MIELVTSLGDAVVVEPARLRDAIEKLGFACPEDAAAPLVLHARLGTLTATPVARARRFLPRRRIEGAVIACLVISMLAHSALLVWAMRGPSEPRANSGSPRTRLVANHATGARAEQAQEIKASPDEVDASPSLALPAAEGQGDEASDASELPGTNADRSSEAARHFDPCANGDCGIIESGPYETSANGKHAGSEYALHPRETRELALSVVTCTVGGGCNTVSGVDQDDIRAEIARHVDELHGCFGAGATAATIEVKIDGGVQVTAKSGGAAADCLAAVIGKLALRGDRGDVTLAFSAD